MTPNQLRNIMQRESLTQAALADVLGLSQPQISRYLSGKDGIPTLVARCLTNATILHQLLKVTN
jgi:transcriptional regulator with XRE-family HTH domain